MSESSIDAYLAVTSFGLLGFNTDEYKHLYPGIAKDLPPIKLSTFDKEQEPTLLCCLHFLLLKLDYEEFPFMIEDCWPYLCKSTKTDFKHAVMASLRHLQMQGTVDVFGPISPEFWGSEFRVKGPDVWLLLRILTDCCVDLAIKVLSPPSSSSHHVPIFESPFSDRATPTPEINSDTGSKKAKRKSIVQLQSEEFHSISHASDAFQNGHSPDPTHLNRSNLLTYIAEIQHQIEESIVMNIAKQNRQHVYMNELDARLKSAKTSLDTAQRRIHKSMKQGGLFALSDSGRKTRVLKLEKIAASLRLMEHLSESTLLGTTATWVDEDKPMLDQSAHLHHEHFPLPEGCTDKDGLVVADRSFQDKLQAGESQLATAGEWMNLGHALGELADVLDTINARCS